MDKIPSRVFAFLPVILLLFLSFFAVRPLLSPGYFSMHDDQQIARLFELDKSLTAGQFPVRWVDGLGFGYGYPLFNFYPPLTYYLGEIYHQVFRVGFIDAAKLVWFTALVGSAITMYFLSKEFFGKTGGIVSAMFYLYAPYRAVDAYVRGAQAELFSFVWPPLIFLAAYHRQTILSGLLLALLMITHNLIFLPFVSFYIAWSLLFKNYRFPIAILIAFGLTAFFWLPALAEKQFTLVDQLLIKNLASYKIHFVCLSQLWYSQWGFGGSVAGCSDGISFALGKIYFLTIAVGLIVSVIKKSKVGLISFGLLALSLFMAIGESQFIWDKISPLWYLQFPWRFLEFAALFSSLLTGAIVLPFKKPWAKVLVVVVAITSVIFTQAKYFSPQTYDHSATDTKLTSDQEIKWHVSSTSFEFMNRRVATKLNNDGGIWVDIDQTQVQSSKFKVQSGNFSPSKENFSPDRFTLVGNSATGATLQFQISNFPGWQIWLDGKPSAIDDNNKYRLLSLTIPGGQHSIAGQFTNTPVRIAGNSVSVLFVLLLCGFIFLYGTNRARS